MLEFPIIDGHNDTLLKLYKQDQNRTFFEESTRGHIDYPRAVKGGLAGGFFAILTPHPDYKADFKGNRTENGYDVPLSPPVDYLTASQATNTMAAMLFQLESESEGKFKVVRTTDELRNCMQNQVLASIFHIEGAEAIDPEFNVLYVLHQAGLRSLGLVWSRPNIFGEGMAFRYPSSPDTGSGLTEKGKTLVKKCNQLGIMVDTSHLNEKGFWNVAELTDAPIVATHANVHAICPSSRNLTDKQLQAVAESDGVVGIHYATNMIRQDGKSDADNTTLDDIVQHIDYVAQHFGVDHVVLGSDFDGTKIPVELRDVTGLPRLVQKLKAHGFSDDELRKITHENWLRVLDKTWK